AASGRPLHRTSCSRFALLLIVEAALLPSRARRSRSYSFISRAPSAKRPAVELHPRLLGNEVPLECFQPFLRRLVQLHTGKGCGHDWHWLFRHRRRRIELLTVCAKDLGAR